VISGANRIGGERKVRAVLLAGSDRGHADGSRVALPFGGSAEIIDESAVLPFRLHRSVRVRLCIAQPGAEETKYIGSVT
jgi:hypothetical protein